MSSRAICFFRLCFLIVGALRLFVLWWFAMQEKPHPREASLKEHGLPWSMDGRTKPWLCVACDDFIMLWHLARLGLQAEEDKKIRTRTRNKTSHIQFFLQQPFSTVPWHSHGLIHKGFPEGDRWCGPTICTELMFQYGYQHACFFGKEAFYCCEPESWGLCVFDATCGLQQASWRAEARTAEDSGPSG